MGGQKYGYILEFQMKNNIADLISKIALFYCWRWSYIWINLCLNVALISCRFQNI